MIQRLTFGDLGAGRDNNLNLLRMLAAATVVFSHSYALTGHLKDDPLAVASHGLTDVATIGVSTFFGISGFLIAQSLARNPSLYRYAIARCLRIVPGLALAKLFCVAVIGWTVTTLPAGAYWSDATTWRFLLGTPFFGILAVLPGVFEKLPYPLAVNGSLWTIPVEVWCYVVAALLAAATLLRRPLILTAALAVALAACAAFPQATLTWLPSGGYGTVPGLVLSFIFGVWLHACGRRVPLSLPVAATALVLLVLSSRSSLFRVAYFTCVPYVALVLAYHPRLLWRRYLRLGDYSYGTYVLAFPVQQFLVWRFGLTQPLAFFPIALCAMLPLAMLSWHFVERPALALKTRLAAYRPRLPIRRGKTSKA